MTHVRWSRVLAVVALLLLWPALRWLKAHLNVPEFAQVPVIGQACENTETKGLLLLALVLVAVFLIIRVLLDQK